MQARSPLGVLGGFLAGLALGFGSALVLRGSTGPDASAPLPSGILAAAPPAPAPGDAGGARAAPRLPEATADGERLAVKVADVPAAAPVAALAGSASGAPTHERSTEVTASGATAVDPSLVALELERALASGILARDGAPHQVVRYLVEAYLRAGLPADALRLARIAGSDPGTLTNIGRSLERGGDPAAAAEAFRLSLERSDAGNWQAVRALARVDPSGALELVQADLDAWGELGDPELEAQRALLLFTAGRDAEAQAALSKLIAAGRVTDGAWNALIDAKPELVRAHLDQLAAAGNSTDPNGTARIHLASLLHEAGDEAAALRHCEELLASLPDNAEALELLIELDAERALAWARARAAREPSAALCAQLGDLLRARGDREGAIAAYQEARRLDPEGWWGDPLAEFAPEVILPEYERRLQGSTDDELWGDYADALWRAGRHADARAAWLRARSIDPSDGEWTGKLRSVLRGEDPLD